MQSETLLFVGDALAAYGFPDGHPFSVDRQRAFLEEAHKRGLHKRVPVIAPRPAARDELLRFHTERYVAWVETCSREGHGYIDYGDTPAFPGVYEAAGTVVGTALDALASIMDGQTLRTFQPIGGLHHSRRDHAAGFCVFNDIGVLIDTLRVDYGITRIAYVDIDVHHGDGVYYPYEDDPGVIVVDIHEDGRFLYPGTGAAHEVGRGHAEGTKLNLPMMPGAGNRKFFEAWERAEDHLVRHKPEFIILQAGADCIMGDPLAHLEFSPAVHAHVTARLIELANTTAKGRLMAFGGGGYDLDNVASAWNEVLRALADPR